MEQESPGSAVTAKQGRNATGTQPRDLGWAEATIWTDRMMSALGHGVKGGKWFSLIYKVIRPATLDIAWQRVARNKGAAGLDGQSEERFSHQMERYLAELQANLASGSYPPNPVKRVEIPKGNGEPRPLGIPTMKDRIVQTALKMVIEPIFRVQFRPGSYGFRPRQAFRSACLTPTKRRDDCVILCASEAEATAALRQITAWVNANGLTSHPDKTRVGDCARPGQRFDFLGFRFEVGRRFVREKSLRAFKDKMRAGTIRSRGDSLERIIAAINSILRGWFGYFKQAGPCLFRGIDQIIRRRLRAEKRPSMKHTIADGPMPSSRIRGCSPFLRPMNTRDTPDEETSDWRAVCGRPARTVRRAGRKLPDPYRTFTAALQWY